MNVKAKLEKKLFKTKDIQKENKKGNQPHYVTEATCESPKMRKKN